MKVESTVRPVKPFEILDYEDNKVEVIFYGNVVELPLDELDEVKKYSYDLHRLIVRDRENLEVTIQNSLYEWLQFAIATELENIAEKTISERVANTEIDVVTLEETIDTIFGGA